MVEEKKRLFFAFEVQAPWPQELPKGRILEETCRHLTLAFLGEVNFASLANLLPSLPKIPFRIGKVGAFDHLLLLPERFPHVVAWNIDWFDDVSSLISFQQAFTSFLKEKGFFSDEKHKNFCSHVTIARKPFFPREWKKAFNPLPLFLSALHLFESLGNSRYLSLWKKEFLLPFEEIEHTADIAFCIRGETLKELYLHAEIALAFHFPPLLSFFAPLQGEEAPEGIILALNDLIGRADRDLGCPFKGVSFHGEMKKTSENLWQWEMIVDV